MNVPRPSWFKGCAALVLAAVWLASAPLVWGAYGGSGTFTKITTRADLTDGYYVVASSNGLMAMTHTNYGSFFTNGAISPSANTLTDPSPAIVWLIQTNATYGGHTIFNEASNKYVSYSGTANAAYAAGAVNGTTGVWSFAYGVGAFDVANVASNTRLLQYNAAAPRFACYTTAQQKLALYKMSSAAAPPSVTTEAASAITTNSATLNGDVTSDGGATVTNRGVVYGTATGLTIDSNKTAAAAGGTGAFSVALTTLTPNQTYYFRAYAQNSAGTTLGDELSFTTLTDETSAPVFGANPGPVSTTAGVAVAFTVAASGNPTPVLALDGATASAGSYSFTTNTGYFIYTPPTNDVGAQTFTFTASNSMGVATQIVSVTVAAATMPGFTSGTGPYVATSGVQWAFTVVATGAPLPALVLQGTTASSGTNFTDSDDGTGLLTYTATTNDLGPRTFTLTASNVMGVVTQTVNVTVTNATPVIDSLVPQSIIAGSTLSLTVTVTDADSPLVTFDVPNTTVDGATWDFNTYSGAFTFTPTTNQVGTNTFTFTAIDETYLESAPSNLVVYVSAAGSPVAVSFGQVRIVGEEGGGTVLIPVNLASATTAQVQFRFSGPTNGTAQRLADFNCSTTLTISAASSGNLEIFIEDDALAEGPESIKVQLAPVLPAYAGATTQAVLYIRDNDAFTVMAANTSDGATQKYTDSGERIFQALCPDVVLIQEFVMTNGITYSNWVAEHFGSNFEYYVESEAADVIPNGLISRFPILDAGEWANTASSGGVNRDFAWATIDLPGTQDLHAVSVHLYSDNAPDRNLEAIALTNLISAAGWRTNGYVTVGGDFNTVNRSEAAITTFATFLTDAKKPADQNGVQQTSINRNYHYDYVLPSTNLNARHRTFNIWGYSFTNGLVYDSRPTWVTWADGLPPPSLTNDVTNLQHMAVVKVFELEQPPGLAAPQAFAATAASRTNINLSFTTNAAGDGVVIVWNQTGSFTTPTGAVPAVGAAFAGGTVLYTGATSPVSHTGLTGCSTYYYRCWSVSGTNYSAAGLSASATTAGPDAPASIWASATNATDFTAAWSAAAGASGYRLDVATDTNFFGGSSGGLTLIDEDFVAYADWTGWGTSEDITSTHYGAASPCITMGDGGGPGTYMISPAVDNPTQMTFYVDCSNPGTTTNYYSLDGGSAWIPLSTVAVVEAGATVTNVLTNAPNLSGSTNVKFRFFSTFNTMYLDDVKVTGGLAIPSSYVAGYSNRTVSGTNQVVTNLEADTTYYFRVRAVDGSCESTNSTTASVTTANMTPGPPEWTALLDRGAPRASYFLGDYLATNFEFAVGTDTNGWTADYGLGTTPNGSGWTWAAADWSRLDGGTGWVFKAKSGERQFTSAGSWYYAGRFATNGFTYYAAGDWTTNNSALSAASYFTVNALNNPDGIGVVSTSSPTSAIDLLWDKDAQGHDVMVVRKLAAASWTEPTPGATYSAGNSLGAGTVVYVGSATNFTDSGLAEATTYDYKFYSVNNGYYSTGVTDQEATLGCAPDAPAGLHASATNATGFTATWDAAYRATNYYLDVSTNADFGGSGSLASDLFISEYVEGSGSEKFIEIFNGTGASVDLSDYALLLYPNGTNSPNPSNTLSGTLANGSVAVFRNSSATNLIGTVNTAVNFNGDDAVALWKLSAASYVDVFGSIGYDPGTAWTVGTNTTLDKTLVRKSSVTGGLTTNPATNFPTLGTEWDQYALNTVSNLDSHTFSGGTAPSYVAGYSNLLLGNVTSCAVTGLTEGVTYYFRVRAEGDCVSASTATMDVVPAPTSVVLYHFTTGVENGQVVVRWRTASEENTVGFYVERWNGTEWVRVGAFIYAEGEGGFGAAYALVDVEALPGVETRYRLVEIETDGEIQVYGPFDRIATVLQFQSPVTMTTNGALLRWLSREGEFYKILRSTNLIAGKAGFRPIATGLPATPPENEYLDPAAAGLGMYLIQVDEEY